MRYSKLLIWAGSFLALSCANSADNTGSAQSQNGFVLNGQVQHLSGGQVILEELNQQNFLPKDTVNISETGKFEFKGKVSEPTIYRLNFPQKGAVMLVLENKEIQINADAGNNFTRPQFKGSKESETIQDLNGLINGIQTKMNSLNQRYAAAQGMPDSLKVIEQQFANAQAQVSKSLKQFIRKNTNSVVGAYAAANMIAVDQEPTFADSVGALLSKRVGNSQYTKQLQNKLAAPRPVAVGQMAPEIKMLSPEGKEISLSSLRGKYVLIDFWASWCGPCRRENPNVVNLYSKYKGKNFEIFGVSLDQSKEKWVQAIKADGLGWMHVSDLKYWQNEAAQRYMVNSIPATFLLDPTGLVIAKDLRGDALAEKLASLLK